MLFFFPYSIIVVLPVIAK